MGQGPVIMHMQGRKKERAVGRLARYGSIIILSILLPFKFPGPHCMKFIAASAVGYFTLQSMIHINHKISQLWE